MQFGRRRQAVTGAPVGHHAGGRGRYTGVRDGGWSAAGPGPGV